MLAFPLDHEDWAQGRGERKPGMHTGHSVRKPDRLALCTRAPCVWAPSAHSSRSRAWGRSGAPFRAQPANGAGAPAAPRWLNPPPAVPGTAIVYVENPPPGPSWLSFRFVPFVGRRCWPGEHPRRSYEAREIGGSKSCWKPWAATRRTSIARGSRPRSDREPPSPCGQLPDCVTSAARPRETCHAKLRLRSTQCSCRWSPKRAHGMQSQPGNQATWAACLSTAVCVFLFCARIHSYNARTMHLQIGRRQSRHTSMMVSAPSRDSADVTALHGRQRPDSSNSWANRLGQGWAGRTEPCHRIVDHPFMQHQFKEPVPNTTCGPCLYLLDIVFCSISPLS